MQWKYDRLQRLLKRFLLQIHRLKTTWETEEPLRIGSNVHLIGQLPMGTDSTEKTKVVVQSFYAPFTPCGHVVPRLYYITQNAYTICARATLITSHYRA